MQGLERTVAEQPRRLRDYPAPPRRVYGIIPMLQQAPMAQRIEHRTSNPTVAGSSPAGRASDLTGRRCCFTVSGLFVSNRRAKDSPMMRFRRFRLSIPRISGGVGFVLRANNGSSCGSRQITAVNLEAEIAIYTVTLQVKPRNRSSHSLISLAC